MKTMEKFLEKYGEIFIRNAAKFLAALIILIVGFKLVNFLVTRLEKGKGFRRIDPNAQSFIKSTVKILSKILIVIIAASVVGIPMTSVSAIIASAGLAIGLALQGGLSNIAGGVLLLIFKPFAVGEYIKTPHGEGTVIKIDIFYTTLRMNDNTKVVVPNGVISNDTVSNVSAYGTRRVELNFSTSYHTDVDKAVTLLKETAAKNSLVLTDPAPFAALKDHNDSSLDYILHAWCNKEDYWTVYFALPAAVKKVFDENGIEIPFPQLDVHMK